MPMSRHAQARIEESIVALFKDFPSLCGFTVDGGLDLADVGLFPAPAKEEAELIREEIRETLSELVEERPEARNFVTGRTFARALH